MDKKIITLQNGIHICVNRFDCGNKINSAVVFSGGSQCDGYDKSGITHMLEHMMFRKLGTITQDELYQLTRAMGTNLRGSTYRDMLYFGITTVKEFLNNHMLLINSLFELPSWNEEEFKREKEVVLRQIESKYYNDIDEYIRKKYLPAKLRGHIIGERDIVEGFCLNDIVEWHNSMMVSSNAYVAISGDVNQDDIDEIVISLSQIKPHDGSYGIVRRKYTIGEKNNIKIINMEDDISNITLLFYVCIEDVYIAELLSAMLGMGDGALLPMLIREQMGITDDITSVVTIYKDFAYMELNMYTYNVNVLTAVEAVIKVLNRVKQYISDTEFNLNVSYLTNWTALNYSCDPEEQSFIAAWRGFIMDGVFNTDELNARYCDITRTELSKYANKLLCSDNLTLIITNNSKIIKPSVLKLKLIELVKRLNV